MFPVILIQKWYSQTRTGDFDIEAIQVVKWSSEALDKLAISDDEKALLVALMASGQAEKLAGFDDFIPGKGAF